MYIGSVLSEVMGTPSMVDQARFPDPKHLTTSDVPSEASRVFPWRLSSL